MSTPMPTSLTPGSSPTARGEKSGPPRLLDQLRELALARFGRPEPGQRYQSWVLRYILFHGKRHPRELGLGQVDQFLDQLAQTEKDPLRAIEEAREALSFLYDDLLHVPLGELPYPAPPKLLDRLRRAIRLRHYSPRTESRYVEWAERYIRFHGVRHPNTMGGAEIEMYLTHLAVDGHVSSSTQNQAFAALLFLYQEVLGIELPRLPTVLSMEEVRQLLAAVDGGEGVFRLMAACCMGQGCGVKNAAACACMTWT